jgi:DNA-binding FadR family transcriptional regulator
VVSDLTETRSRTSRAGTLRSGPAARARTGRGRSGDVTASKAGTDKLGTVIARRIEANILRGQWKVGQSLGSESELIEQYGVSRASLREAIRQMEVRGTVKMQRGFNGGLMVSEPPRQAAARTIALYLELVNADVDELFEARKILEPFGARLAAERASKENLLKLKTLMAELEAAPRDFEISVPMHIAIRDAIGEMANNPALTIFASALNRFTVESIASEIAADYPKRNVTTALGYKARTVDAILRRNAARAETFMGEDLDNRHSTLRKYFIEHAKQEATNAPSIVTSPSTGIHPKLGQIVAVTLAHKIGREQIDAGGRLGSEPDLIAQYGVSRAVFREAIRILEPHGFVRTRRGSSGGLFVGSPDPSYTVASAVGFLQASGMKQEHFVEIRGTLAVNAAALAAQRISATDRTRLEQALSANLASSGANIVRTSRAFHTLIGDLSHNRALSIFNRVILELNARPDEGYLPKDVITVVKRNNVRISDAISVGDVSLARRRMTEHVKDIASGAAADLSVFH